MQHENNYILFHLFIYLFIYLFIFGAACNIFRVVFVASLIKKHAAPRLNFPGACNVALLHCIHMKMLHRGPKALFLFNVC